jgi:hypothetical protein
LVGDKGKGEVMEKRVNEIRKKNRKNIAVQDNLTIFTDLGRKLYK